MNAPSEKDKRRIVEMFDSFCKTVSRNGSRNAKRAKKKAAEAGLCGNKEIL